jgi:DNA relaxase NicK
MHYENGVFVTSNVPAKGDSAPVNWDNNGGRNYTFEVQDRM